jgi:hypothetical protein
MSFRLLVPALLLAAGCGAKDLREESAPLDRYTWPTGLAVLGDKLLVASSNFDLRYASEDGGSVISIDPAAAPQGELGAVLGAERIASFAGPIAIADAADPACGLPATEALVAARSTNTLYRFEVDPGTGALACGADCARGLGSTRSDAFALAVTCRGGSASAWLGFLRGPSGGPWLERLDLNTAAATPEVVQLASSGPVRAIVHDPDHDRLLVGIQTTVTRAPLAWMDLAGGACAVGATELEGGCRSGELDLGALVTGADITALALSSGQPRRLYAGLRLFDPTLAASVGFRPGVDVDGVLAVFELSESAIGQPALTLLDTVSVGLGIGEIAVIPRAGKRDLVVATALVEGTVALYDDESGALAIPVFGRESTGQPIFGRRPFGLAVQPGVVARVYVGSFDQGFVTPLLVPIDQPSLSGPEKVDVVGTTEQQVRRIGSSR